MKQLMTGEGMVAAQDEAAAAEAGNNEGEADETEDEKQEEPETAKRRRTVPCQLQDLQMILLSRFLQRVQTTTLHNNTQHPATADAQRYRKQQTDQLRNTTHSARPSPTQTNNLQKGHPAGRTTCSCRCAVAFAAASAATAARFTASSAAAV